MNELSERQTKILKAVVEEYTETAEPVGSEKIEKEHSLGVSPATIRNEMMVLTEAGYLRQPHTSAGRIPTPMALKFYIKELMEEKQMSVTDEVTAKERVWDYRFEFDRLMQEVTRALAEKTKTTAVAQTDKGEIYSAGYANLLDMPEFYDIDVTRTVLELLDESERLHQIFDRPFGDDSIHVLLGEELEKGYLSSCGLVFTHFEAGPKKGALGVIGSCRLNYPVVIPMVRYFGNLITEMTKNWK